MSNDLRPAAVAGMFYPGSAATLARDVGLMLHSAASDFVSDVSTALRRPKALVVPHAGYLYSGPIAASAYAQLNTRRQGIKRIILLGPTHRIAVNGIALPTCGAFVTPLGAVRLDRAALDSVAHLPQIVCSDEAHAEEHALEVQLPFLQILFGDFLLVPLAVGKVEPQVVADVIEHFWGGEETLIVISSDLSHYLPYAAARQVDDQTAQRILELDPTLGHFQACGATPINGLLLAAQRHHMRVQLLDLRNSGDTAGDRSRVVGYAAFAFYEPEMDDQEGGKEVRPERGVDQHAH